MNSQNLNAEFRGAILAHGAAALPTVLLHQRGSKSSFPTALMFATCRRIPTSASTHQEPEKGDLIRAELRGAVLAHGAAALLTVLAHNKTPTPPRTPLGP